MLAHVTADSRSGGGRALVALGQAGAQRNSPGGQWSGSGARGRRNRCRHPGVQPSGYLQHRILRRLVSRARPRRPGLSHQRRDRRPQLSGPRLTAARARERSVCPVTWRGLPKRSATLAANGAIAVEMEAAGIAPRAERHGLPLYCIRAVTDLSGENLANDFNKALRLDGQFDTILVLKGSLRNPMVRLPELLRLRKRCVRAAHVLGEFFADSGI